MPIKIKMKEGYVHVNSYGQQTYREVKDAIVKVRIIHKKSGISKVFWDGSKETQLLAMYDMVKMIKFIKRDPRVIYLINPNLFSDRSLSIIKSIIATFRINVSLIASKTAAHLCNTCNVMNCNQTVKTLYGITIRACVQI